MIRSRHPGPLLATLLCLSGPGVVRAHNPDTSYARLQIRATHIELRYTADIFTLLKITRLDANQDQRVTRDELTQAAPAIELFLRQAILLELNGQPTNLGQAAPPIWPSGSSDAITAPEWHTAQSLIHFTFSRDILEPPEDVALAFDRFDVLGERHTILGVFEQNGQSQEVTFTRPEPDYLFFTGYEPSLAGRLARFFRLGVEHIFLGYDHICFLLALIVVSRFGELIKIVTSFTVAHTITLVLATLQVVTLPTRLIETGIALTIVYVAAENLWIKQTSHRWWLTFAFGLVHGFGFANVLRELGLPASGTVRCLLAFNLGVELGQLAIVLVLLPCSLALARWRHGSKARAAISVPILLLGLGWFLERLSGWAMLPF